MATTHTLSFTILDDLSPCYGPTHVRLASLAPNEIRRGVLEIVEPFCRPDAPGVDSDEISYVKNFLSGRQNDPTGYYFIKDFDADEVTAALTEEKFYRLNRYEKYYVVAFAIGYVRFEVFSKDCDKELIDWGGEGPVAEAGGITDPDYNENPVVRMFARLGDPAIEIPRIHSPGALGPPYST